MNKERDALQRALHALKLLPPLAWTPNTANRNYAAITAIKEALAQPEQEPVACIEDGDLYFADEIDWQTLQQQGIAVQLLYTTPPQRKPLTDEEIQELWESTASYYNVCDFARAIEAAHGIKE